MPQSKENTPKRLRKRVERDEEMIQEMIRIKAYELHERRGWGHGKDVDDWLEAERIVMAGMKNKKNKK